MIVASEISESVLDDETSSGSTCKFIDLENGYGLKCYKECYYKNYETAYTVQKYMAERNAAPKVGESIKIGDYYCYVTEVIEVMSEYGHDNDYAENKEDLDDDDSRYQDMQEAEDLFAESNEWGYDYLDDHTGNYGYLANGTCVVIDFDICMSLYHDIIKCYGYPDGLLRRDVDDQIDED